MPTSNAEELGLFLKCTVIGRGVFGPCACCTQEVYLLGGLPIGGVSWRPPVVTSSVSFPVEVEFEFRW